MCSNLAVLHSYSVSLFFTNVAPVIPWMLFFYTGDFFGAAGGAAPGAHQFTTGTLEVVVGGLVLVTLCHLVSTVGFKNLTISRAFGIFLIVCYVCLFVATLLCWTSLAV